jgi:hypothetical protein
MTVGRGGAGFLMFSDSDVLALALVSRFVFVPLGAFALVAFLSKHKQ